MEKEFVPYELASELKQLGFNEPCLALYEFRNGHNKLEKSMERSDTNSWLREHMKVYEWYVTTPLYQQAFRWFREKHNIDAWVQPFVSEKQNGKPFLPDESYAYYIFEDGVYVADGVNFLDSEEAEMACLKKLIDHCKN